MKDTFSSKWEVVRKKGLIIYVLKYFIIFGVGVPLLKMGVLILRGLYLNLTFPAYFERTLVGLKFDLIFFSVLSILASILQWVLNKCKYRKHI